MIKFENSLKYEQTRSFGNAFQGNFWLVGSQNHSKMEYGEEFQLTFPCRFQLAKFPFDSHECPIYFGDKRYKKQVLIINNITIIYESSQLTGIEGE